MAEPLRVEFHFDFGSPNAYLAELVLPEIEQRTGVKFDYVPVLLGGVYKATGNMSPAESLRGIKNKAEYNALETERFLRRHDITKFESNPFFPVNTLMLMRGVVAAQFEGLFEPYFRAAYHHMWVEPKKMDDPQIFRDAFTVLGPRYRPPDRTGPAGRRQEEADRQHPECRDARRVRLTNLLRRGRNVLWQGSFARGRGIDRRTARVRHGARRRDPLARTESKSRPKRPLQVGGIIGDIGIRDCSDRILDGLPSRIHEVMDRHVAATPDRVALIDDGAALTYRELDRAVNGTADALRTLGIRAGDRVMIVSENCIALACLLIAAFRLDAWAIVANPRLSPRELDQIRDHSGARRAFFTADVSQEAAAHALRYGAPRAGCRPALRHRRVAAQ